MTGAPPRLARTAPGGGGAGALDRTATTRSAAANRRGRGRGWAWLAVLALPSCAHGFAVFPQVWGCNLGYACVWLCRLAQLSTWLFCCLGLMLLTVSGLGTGELLCGHHVRLRTLSKWSKQKYHCSNSSTCFFSIKAVQQ